MGQSCSSCQKPDKDLQILSKATENAQANIPSLHDESQRLDTDSWQSLIKTSKLQRTQKETYNSHQSVVSERRNSLQIQLQTRQAESKMIEDDMDDGFQEESEIIYKPMQQSLMQPRQSTNSTEGVSIIELPKCLNQITQKKLAELGPFQYNQREFEVEGAVQRPAILLDSKFIYEGQWKEDKRNGRGRQMWLIGSVYEGYWKDNKAHGAGRLIHDNGDVYEGQWLNDQAQGYGVYTEISGMIYKGNWKSDKRVGKGSQDWPDGAYFKGEFRDGKKHGKGRFEWPDGSWYEGQFHENNIHGKGTYRWKDGNTYEGTWRDNKMEGKGVYKWSDGKMYEGEYKNDKKHGFGVLKWPDGKIYKGQWLDGKQVGQSQNRKGVLREVKVDKSFKKKVCKSTSHKVKFAAHPI